MSEEKLISVNIEESPVIQVEITSQDNKIDLSFAQSIASSLGAHNSSKDAHSTLLSSIVKEINDDISLINSELAAKSNISDTYSKTEVDSLFDSKLENSTTKGNVFNGANQLVELNSSGQLPSLDGSLLSNVTGTGISKFENKGIVTSALNLSANVITVAAFSEAVSISLPEVTDLTMQATCILDFSTTNNSSPSIVNSNLKWSDKNLGKAPAVYSLLPGVRNLLIFKSIWISDTLFWEVEYSTRGAVEQTFNQPTLVNNGSLGGSSFAVASAGNIYSGSAYYAFDNNSSTSFSPYHNSGFIFYTPYPLKVSQLQIQQGGGIIYSWSIYGSNDNSNYTFLASGSNSASGVLNTPIASANQGYFKYYKFLNGSGSGSLGYDVIHCNIQATYISV